MITKEKFVEVISSLCEEDFEKGKKFVRELVELFDDISNRELFESGKIDEVASFLNTYDDDTLFATLAVKFFMEKKQ